MNVRFELSGANRCSVEAKCSPAGAFGYFETLLARYLHVRRNVIGAEYWEYFYARFKESF
jgi:hypothetical protein